MNFQANIEKSRIFFLFEAEKSLIFFAYASIMGRGNEVSDSP